MGLTKPRAAQIFNLDYKQSTRVVTVANVVLVGGAPSSVDGVSLIQGDRILVTGQSTGSQNGIYKVSIVGSGADGTWIRTKDSDQTGEVEAGMIVMVTEGSEYADTQWKLITNDPIVIDTTALTFTQNYSANSISAGTSNVVVFDNANVTISSTGTANVLTISNTGTVTTGTASVTGNVTAGNLITGGQISAAGNISGGFLLGNGSQITGIVVSAGASITNGTSNVTIQANSNVVTGVAGSTVGTFANTGLFVTGIVSATGNISGNFILGNGSQLTGLPATYSDSNVVTLLSNFGSNSISTTGNITAANLNSSNADLAEMYVADAGYTAGTVVEFGGNHEITVTHASHSTAVAGVVSTAPSYLMNIMQSGEHVLPVALTGRVPCYVMGVISKGDRLVSSDRPGVAQTLNKSLYEPGCIIGKALEDYNSPDTGIIEVAVGRF